VPLVREVVATFHPDPDTAAASLGTAAVSSWRITRLGDTCRPITPHWTNVIGAARGRVDHRVAPMRRLT